MGKKKPKVKWTAVNSVPLNYNSDSGLVSSISQKHKSRGWDTFTTNTTMPPRFERKTNREKNVVYYDGEFCETEELPNGFVKVRSKHLDVLFKRDFYTKKIERMLNSVSKQPSHSTLAETNEDSIPYNCHNSSDGSIIYNIDHLLVSSNFSFEGSTNATANPSKNVSLENEFVVDNGSMDQNAQEINNAIDDEHAEDVETPEDPSFVDNSEDRVRHDSGFVDSSMNLPADNSATEPPVGNQFFPSTPGVYVYIPSENSLIPCKEVFVAPPTPRDPRCTCAPATNISIAAQGNQEQFQVVHHAPPGFIPGPHPFWAGNSLPNGEYYNTNMAMANNPHHMMSYAPFGPYYPSNLHHMHRQPVPYQEEYPLSSTMVENEESVPQFNPYVEPFPPVVGDLLVHPGDGSGPLSTSELASDLTKQNTYQLFPENKKLHPLFGYSSSASVGCNGGFQAYGQERQDVSPRKVIEPDYDWMAQQEHSFRELEFKNLVHQSGKSAPCDMGSPLKSMGFIPQLAQGDILSPKSSIPGLPVEFHASKKAQKKKRRRKRTSANEKKNVYSSDETVGGVETKQHSSIFHKIQREAHGNEGCPSQISSDMDSDKLESLFEARSMEHSHEVELSDALASSLVDPFAKMISNDVEKENFQEVLVESMVNLIFDVVDKNNVHEVLKNVPKNINSKSVAKSNSNMDQIPSQEAVSENGLMLGNASNTTDKCGEIIEELIIAALKHSDESRESQDIVENLISSEIFVEMKYFTASVDVGKQEVKMVSKSRKKAKAFKDGSFMEKKVNVLKASYSEELIKENNSLSSNKEMKANDYKNVQPNIQIQSEKITPLVLKRSKKHRKKYTSKSELDHRVMINDSELEMLRPIHTFGQTPSLIVSVQENLDVSQQQIMHGSVIKAKTSQFESLENLEPEENALKRSFSQEPKGPKKNKQVKMTGAVKTSKEDSTITSKKSQSETSTSLNAEVKKKTKKSKKVNSKVEKNDQKKDFVIKVTKKAVNEDGIKKQNLEENFSEKKNKKSGKKNKPTSEPAHKVMINDSELQLIRSNRILRIDEVFSPEKSKIFQTTGFNENIFVDNLGVGIDRGWMELGRLPSSKLVPFKDQSCQEGEAEIEPLESKDAETTKSLHKDDDIGLD